MSQPKHWNSTTKQCKRTVKFYNWHNWNCFKFVPWLRPLASLLLCHQTHSNSKKPWDLRTTQKWEETGQAGACYREDHCTSPHWQAWKQMTTLQHYHIHYKWGQTVPKHATLLNNCTNHSTLWRMIAWHEQEWGIKYWIVKQCSSQNEVISDWQMTLILWEKTKQHWSSIFTERINYQYHKTLHTNNASCIASYRI